jgi:hypothetical protein
MYGSLGRPPLPGYKPQIKIGNIYTSCIITPQNSKVEAMGFGIEHDVFIELQFEDLYLDKVMMQERINLCEGERLIVVGRFTN